MRLSFTVRIPVPDAFQRQQQLNRLDACLHFEIQRKCCLQRLRLDQEFYRGVLCAAHLHTCPGYHGTPIVGLWIDAESLQRYLRREMQQHGLPYSSGEQTGRPVPAIMVLCLASKTPQSFRKRVAQGGGLLRCTGADRMKHHT